LVKNFYYKTVFEQLADLNLSSPKMGNLQVLLDDMFLPKYLPKNLHTKHYAKSLTVKICTTKYQPCSDGWSIVQM